MRALIDTNVLINYLLSRNPTATATWIIIQAGVEGHVLLLMAPGVVEELVRKVASDTRPRRRIPRGAAEELVAYIARVAEIVPVLPEPFPKVVRIATMTS